MVFY
jgi:NhaP-type Na+/H+ or K+/H+ antiporter